MLFLSWSSTNILYVFWFGLQKRQPPLPQTKPSKTLPPQPCFLHGPIYSSDWKSLLYCFCAMMHCFPEEDRDLDNSGKSLAFLSVQTTLWLFWHLSSGDSSVIGIALTSLPRTVQTGLDFKSSGGCSTSINVLFSSYKWVKTYYCLNWTKERESFLACRVTGAVTKITHALCSKS